MSKTILVFPTGGLPVHCKYDSANVGKFVNSIERISRNSGGVNVYLDFTEECMLYNGRSGSFVIPQKDGLPRVY